ncbi:LacI family DNA-binding transcriptional regulator [Pseudarthrobacter sp. P1]|uniref:LacI family DNA-binding transcriptional regulator n=1 Tax=Pseudarthrobacter sp. P1 TaxID=3418418 RepID=UPI003CF9ACF2
MRKATSADVARRAGVSRSAVSFVLNGRADGNIAKDKQALILAAARELDYTPNAVARSLQSQRTHTIGVVTDSIASSPYAGKLLKGATDAALARGYLLLVIDTHQDASREAAAFTALRDRQVDALMFAAMSLRSYDPPAQLAAGPAVLANSFDPSGALRGVVPDEVSGGRSAAGVLIEAGHRDIAYLCGTPEMVATGRRLEGFLQAVAAAGLPPATVQTAGWEINEGYDAAMDLLRAPGGGVRADRPTGIACANDRVAVGVIIACGQLGLRVPEDLSILGYDDDEPLAATCVPGLTTVALPHREMGEHAITLLLDAVDGGPAPAGGPTTMLPCPVVTRGSVAGPAF